MNHMIQYEVVIVSIFFVHAVLAGDKQLLKIVNSTNIRELKLTVPNEDKTGAVAYVYAVQGSDVFTEAPTTADSHSIQPLKTEESTSTERRPTNKKECVTRVIEKMKGDERIVSYKATAREAESAGKKIVDTTCKGDENYDMIDRKNLANLEDDIYHLP